MLLVFRGIPDVPPARTAAQAVCASADFIVGTNVRDSTLTDLPY